MPVSNATSALAAGFLPMFGAETGPSTTLEAAEMWADAYTKYLIAGQLPVPSFRTKVLSSGLATAFNPELAGGGPVLLLQALALFWAPAPPFPVPYMGATAVVAGFFPINPNLNSPQPDTATPQQQADGLASVIASLTLKSVKVLIPPATSPVPLQ